MLRPTLSKDGKARCSVEVSFRVDAYALASALLELIDYEHYDLALDDYERLIQRTPKYRIEQSLRSSLGNGGRNWMDYGHEQLSLYQSDKLDAVLQIALRRIRELWPNLT